MHHTTSQAWGGGWAACEHPSSSLGSGKVGPGGRGWGGGVLPPLILKDPCKDLHRVSTRDPSGRVRQLVSRLTTNKHPITICLTVTFLVDSFIYLRGLWGSPSFINSNRYPFVFFYQFHEWLHSTNGRVCFTCMIVFTCFTSCTWAITQT